MLFCFVVVMYPPSGITQVSLIPIAGFTKAFRNFVEAICEDQWPVWHVSKQCCLLNLTLLVVMPTFMFRNFKLYCRANNCRQNYLYACHLLHMPI